MHFKYFSKAKHCDFAAGSLATCCVLLRAVSNLLASSITPNFEICFKQ